jgi:DNA-binding SARP family transcriptional activator
MQARDVASRAISLLDASASVVELVSAQVAHASALAFSGDMVGARHVVATALQRAPAGQRVELAGEIAEIEAWVGESNRAWPLIDGVADFATQQTVFGEQLLYARALLKMREGDLSGARDDIALFTHRRPAAMIAFEARRLIAEGILHALSGGQGLADAANDGTRVATAQGADLWSCIGRLLTGLTAASDTASDAILQAASDLPVAMSCLAEVVLQRLPQLSPAACAAVAAEAEKRPWRWRVPTRKALEHAPDGKGHVLARLLGQIGEVEDISRLRIATQRRSAPHGIGQELARRLASKVFVDDLGRVQIAVGSRVVEGAEVRRKVLALMCLLLTRPRFSSTRDEVLDSLWPEHNPSSALNSLNQTVYFLRRVFEPEFRDDETPGYVGQDGETIWLDSDLIECRSGQCLEIIRSMPREPTPEGAVELATLYRSRFALDFAYDEWSAPYRDALHASYLRVVEHAVRLDLDSGHFDRGTFIAERAHEVDPESEEIQAALVRLYRLSGAHAAAAEQYAHYANALRDLGIDPPAFAEV